MTIHWASEDKSGGRGWSDRVFLDDITGGKNSSKLPNSDDVLPGVHLNEPMLNGHKTHSKDNEK